MTIARLLSAPPRLSPRRGVKAPASRAGLQATNLDMRAGNRHGTAGPPRRWPAHTLTAAQHSAVLRISRFFQRGTGPQVVRLSGPEHRGKTHAVQHLLSSMATAAWAETGPRPALPWETEGDWRVSRTRLAMPTAMLRASMDWWWSSTKVLPDTPNDLVGSLRRNALELLSAIDEPAAEKLGFSKEDWWKLVAETTVSVGLDRIPFFGAGTAVVRCARQGLYMKSTDSAASALKLVTIR